MVEKLFTNLQERIRTLEAERDGFKSDYMRVFEKFQVALARIERLEATKEEEIANVHDSYQTGKEYELLVSAQVDMLTKAYRAQVTDLRARIERAKGLASHLQHDTWHDRSAGVGGAAFAVKCKTNCIACKLIAALDGEPSKPRCKACRGETCTADESGLCAPCRVMRDAMREAALDEDTKERE